MKFTLAIAVLAIAVHYSQATVTCAASSYCMSCSSTSSTGCLSCFNWGSGSVGARKLSSASTYTCTTALSTKTTDCKVYTGGASYSGTSGTCRWCNSKTWRNEAYSAASVNTMTCSNTAINTTTCSTAISNCYQMTCRDYASASSTDYSKCATCKKGYWGTIDSTTMMYSACSNSGTNPVSNCDWFGPISASASGCSFCKSNYAVKSADSSCYAYTTDSNCRSLQTDNTNCLSCWDAYYWNATVCKLNAKVVSAIMIVALSALSFLMF